MKFDIRAYNERGIKGKVRLNPIAPRMGPEIEYQRALRRMLREVAKIVREDVIPAYTAEKRLTQDGPRDWLASLAAMRSRLVGTADAMVGRVLATEAGRHTDAWQRSLKRTLGVDMGAIIRQEDLAGVLEIAAARNTGLITSLADDTIKRIEQTVLRNASTGGSVKSLREQLQNDLGVMDSRAKLIARDQVSKMNADLNRQRHLQAGITEYEWQTSQDERVRPRHAELNGKTYKYSEPSGAEEGLPPGQPILCRCVAIPVVTF